MLTFATSNKQSTTTMKQSSNYPTQCLYKDHALFTCEEEEAMKKLYQSNCEEFDETPTEDGLAEFIDDNLDADLNDLFANLKYSKWNDCPCVIVGHAGLWNGNREIVPMRAETLSDALRTAMQGNYQFYAEVTMQDGYITVSKHHHDGTNVYDIHLLNAKGRKVNHKENAERLSDSKYWSLIKGYLL